ncbi:maleylpyruvate isomerase N-terminal domain-containing protein [Streptomyces sp. TR02-1]|uniref:maleylpyruvate isomerase N-terminal domain-containing protein n=1 Tax=Streptomyces sp. TR02-1 TaxID=3385977 RepID=UPI0039A0A130
MHGGDVERAVTGMLEVLGPHRDGDWSVPAGSLRWSCHRTAAHVAHDLLAYAGQLAGGARTAYLPFDLVVRPRASPGDVLEVVRAAGGILGRTLAGAAPRDRAWHWGPCDAEGFAAMGVAETLLHTVDITRGLGVPWTPPADLCEDVLRRLFPEAPAGAPVPVLLWCTGRGELPGRVRRTSWTWRAAVDDGRV